MRFHSDKFMTPTIHTILIRREDFLLFNFSDDTRRVVDPKFRVLWINNGRSIDRALDVVEASASVNRESNEH